MSWGADFAWFGSWVLTAEFETRGHGFCTFGVPNLSGYVGRGKWRWLGGKGGWSLGRWGCGFVGGVVIQVFSPNLEVRRGQSLNQSLALVCARCLISGVICAATTPIAASKTVKSSV